MFFVIDENNNKVEAYDKEGVLAVLAQAIADGSLSGIVADSAFVSQLKCCVGGATHKMAFVTQAKYNELKESDGLLDNCMYFITDDTKGADTDALLTTLSNKVNSLDSWKKNIESGMTSVPKANTVTPAVSITATVTQGKAKVTPLVSGTIYLATFEGDSTGFNTGVSEVVTGIFLFLQGEPWTWFGDIPVYPSSQFALGTWLANYTPNANHETNEYNLTIGTAEEQVKLNGTITLRKIGTVST